MEFPGLRRKGSCKRIQSIREVPAARPESGRGTGWFPLTDSPYPPSVSFLTRFTRSNQALPSPMSCRMTMGPEPVTLQLGSKILLTARDGLRTLLAFLYLGIGVFVLLRGDRLPRALHFYILCLAAFVVCLFSYTPKLSCVGLVGIRDLRSCLPASSRTLPSFLPSIPRRHDGWPQQAVLCYTFLPSFWELFDFLWLTGHLAALGLPRTARSSGIIDRVELVYFCAWIHPRRGAAAEEAASDPGSGRTSAAEMGQLRNAGRCCALQSDLCNSGALGGQGHFRHGFIHSFSWPDPAFDGLCAHSLPADGRGCNRAEECRLFYCEFAPVDPVSAFCACAGPCACNGRLPRRISWPSALRFW